ncbi:CusA/CzcA family heavy metal efflux RND transporter [Sinomicrobium weinanense]|uniref:CusA/CzcA family heavy metal efflux RND transporter n=1 Tax=Sinomicrobium weinanense TaxID=2842200 RepID=A0A926JT12_9FLAO|nr:CusA/CzcA family heavy metal efflux RND transporter [Sinomicrobium weinanense]MBC9796728.1 CusA/CzcA family heavy metal efflux RND transporter [Sinomicrobium weinanense]MBU3123999.1 CusA/CzcA family heavy metal efflux RND transporter [Sinomicrobium weinanense]
MIDKIIGFSIKNKIIVFLMVIAIVGGGWYAVKTINLDSVPDITNNQVQIITVAPNLGTEDIEQFVTYTVELAVSNLPEVEEIRSVSRFGLSVVTVVFADDMGTYLPRQLVSEKLSEIREDIPAGFGEPVMGPITTGLGEIYQYTVKPLEGYEDQYSPVELRTVQDWIVKRQMALLPGVVEVNSFGGNIRQYEVTLNPARLNSAGVSIHEVFDALEQNNANTGGAYIEKNHMANFIRGEGLVKSLDDIRNIVIKTVGGQPVLIGSVAEDVRFGSQVRYGAVTRDGEGEAVGGMVLLLKGENSNKVIQNVKERVEEIEKSLPEGLVIEPFIDRSDLIKRTTDTVTKNLVEGALIVIFVLVLLLGSFRGGLLVASVIPLSLFVALILMKVSGVWANLMSLGAIDFGIIVDGAVIIVEGTVHFVEKRLGVKKQSFTRQEMDEIAYTSGSKMMNSAFFGQLIILIVFTPILFLTGVEGKMFQPMAYTFGFAMIGAIVLCLTYVPAMSALLLKPSKGNTGSFAWLRRNFGRFEKGIKNLGDRIIVWCQNIYQPILKKALKFKYAVVISAVGLLGISLFVFSRMGGEFLPKLDEGDMAVQVLLRPGSSLSESIATTTKVEKIVTSFPEVKTMVSRIGVADIPTDPMPMDIADCIITLEKDKLRWTSADTKEELIEKIKEAIETIPGINTVFTQPVELRFNELLTGVREDIAVKLYGEDLGVLAEKAEQMAGIIRGIDGVGDVRPEATSGLPQMTVTYNRQKMAKYGLTVEKLNTYVSTAFAGRSAGVVFEGEKRFDLVVRFDEKFRKDINNLRNLFVDLPSGGQIPIEEVARIDYKPGPMQISRDNTSRRVSVGVNVRGRDVQSLVEDIQEKLDAELNLPPGYYIKYGGAFENLQRARGRLQVVVPIALAMIFILLYFALKSLPQTVMIYMAVPLAAIGGILSLWMRGMPFSISAGVGFIVLFGVAVLNGLVLVSRFNSLEEEGVTDIRERIIRGTRERLRPIILTALTDVLGFLPMAVSSSAGAEVQRPLATVVIGGLVTATLLTLIVVPVLYYIMEVRKSKKQQITMKTRNIIPGLGIMLLFFLSGNIQAQQSPKVISLDTAVSIALEKYPGIKQAELAVDEQKALKSTAFDPGMTNISTGGEEYGGPDRVRNTLTLGQSNIDIFGTVARSSLNKARVAEETERLELTRLDLAFRVYNAYYNTVNAREKLRLAVQLDSIYNNFLQAAKLRYETEATTKLEFLAAEGQYGTIVARKIEAANDYKKRLNELGQWILADGPFEVEDVEVLIPEQQVWDPDRSRIENHPLLEVARKETATRKSAWRAEKAGFLPKFNASYGWQEIAGQNGFYSWNLGLSVPLFFWNQGAKAKAAKIRTEMAGENVRQQQISLQTMINTLQNDYDKLSATVRLYREQLLPLALEQVEAANLSYREGEIDYVSFIQNLDNAKDIQNAYLERLQKYNATVIQLKYLLEPDSIVNHIK